MGDAENGNAVVPRATHNFEARAEVNDMFVFDARQSAKDVFDREANHSLRLEYVADNLASQFCIAFGVLVCHLAVELIDFVGAKEERIHKHKVAVFDKTIVILYCIEDEARKCPKLPAMPVFVIIINMIKRGIAFKKALTYLILFAFLPSIRLVGIVAEEYDFGVMI